MTAIINENEKRELNQSIYGTLIINPNREEKVFNFALKIDEENLIKHLLPPSCKGTWYSYENKKNHYLLVEYNNLKNETVREYVFVIITIPSKVLKSLLMETNNNNTSSTMWFID